MEVNQLRYLAIGGGAMLKKSSSTPREEKKAQSATKGMSSLAINLTVYAKIFFFSDTLKLIDSCQ